MPSKLESVEDYDSMYTPAANEDGLIIRISPSNYHMQYDPETSDWWVQSRSVQKRGLGAYNEAKETRKKGLEAVFESREKNEWMKALGEEEVEKTKRDFSKWMSEGPAAAVNGIGAGGDGDAVMGGT